MLTTPENIRTLQRKLYGKAKQEKAYCFYALYDKIYRADILIHAYNLVRANKGSAGIDGAAFEAIETGERITAFLSELEEALKIADDGGLEYGACLEVKNIGKPCAGKSHARFDERGLASQPRYGYLGAGRRKGRKQISQPKDDHASSLLDPEFLTATSHGGNGKKKATIMPFPASLNLRETKRHSGKAGRD